MSVNSVTISGNLGRDPEIRATQSGTNILSFSLAVNERIKKGDQWDDYTNWVDVVVFGRRADSLSRILQKGMKVVVNGHLRYSQWERDGNKRSKLEVIANEVDIMQRRDDSQSQPNGSYAPQRQQQGNYTNQQQYAPQNGSQQPTGGYQQQYHGQEQYQGQGYQQPQYQQGYQQDVASDDIPF